ncbi:RimK/LysX family protein [Saprospiraceae bacterium]|nr:RimK/LysX family protein [Saprospiraceae bacterium]
MKIKITIGRKDKVDFPKLGLKNIDIKMDTGAYTSSIHCREIKTKLIDGKEALCFTLLDPSHAQYKKKEYSTTNYKQKQIKNSFGSSEKRFIIETQIKLFGKKYPIELSLSERGQMRTPILIGRRFLMGKFVVDSAKYNLSYKKSKKKVK